jgi:hypothetical protein
MKAEDFIRGQKRTVDGFSWYCQIPGISWATAPDDDGDVWELYHTDGPSWWLMGPDYSERNMSVKLRWAMENAVKYLRRWQEENATPNEPK